jgi:hypothetical protein
MKRIGIEYYLDKVPGNVFKEKCDFDTLEEVIEHYRQFKISVKNYYLDDKALKETHPKLYKRLTGGEVREIEIRKMTERFYMKNAGKLNNTLNTEEYELE